MHCQNLKKAALWQLFHLVNDTFTVNNKCPEKYITLRNNISFTLQIMQEEKSNIIKIALLNNIVQFLYTITNI